MSTAMRELSANHRFWSSALTFPQQTVIHPTELHISEIKTMFFFYKGCSESKFYCSRAQRRLGVAATSAAAH